MNLPEGLRGIITVLNTPFTEENRIDAAGLEKNAAYALDAGVAGFLVPAMAGEVAFLNDAERESVVIAVLKAVRGLVPVIGGASAETSEKRVYWAQRITELGCDGVLASIPFVSEKQYNSEVRQLAAVQPGFLMLQDWCSDGYGLPLPLILHLFEDIPCFACLKIEVANSGPKYTEILAATQGRLHVSGGWAVTEMIDGLDRGVHAFMPTGLHRSYVNIYHLFRRGKREQAAALFSRIKPILDYSNQDLPCSIHFFKRLLHAQGIYATSRIRQPLQHPVNEEQCADMIALAQQVENDSLL